MNCSQPFAPVREEWADFVRAKALREGDAVVLLRLSHTLRQQELILRASCATTSTLMRSKPLVVTYSPLDPNSDFLVSTPVFDNSVGVNWMSGMQVRKMREDYGENHVRTITSTTFSDRNLIHYSPWEVTPCQEQSQQQPPRTLQLFPL
ncbi:hypothetical protein Bca4012_055130 [Brassica carinata]|uniref:Uncharacterized protein n=1 Tax=Brassica carinata TaxID=52824 RepID=A0A8X7VVW7_BRACI|nr:hypothetical protein Bca52824_011889 [Brassica carinata]